MKVTGNVAGGGRGPRVEIDVDPLTEFEGILAAAEAKLTSSGAGSTAADARSEPAAGTKSPGGEADTPTPETAGGRGLAGLSDAPTAILGEDAASRVHGALGVRRAGSPRIEVEIDRQEFERDGASAGSPGEHPGESGKPGSGKDDSQK